MPAATQQKYPLTPEWLRLRELCRQQGRKLYWVAGQANMAYQTLYQKMNGYPMNAWQPGERAAIAAALGVAERDIWGEADDGHQDRKGGEGIG